MQIGTADYGMQAAKQEGKVEMNDKAPEETTPAEIEKDLSISEAVAQRLSKLDEADAIKATETEAAQEIQVPNEFAIGAQLGIIRPTFYPQHGTKQSCYRYAAWLLTLAEVLPDEETGAWSFEEIRNAHKRDTGQTPSAVEIWTETTN